MKNDLHDDCQTSPGRADQWRKRRIFFIGTMAARFANPRNPHDLRRRLQGF
jgi:hypothetical protein